MKQNLELHGRVKEVYYCKTKISPGSEHYLGTFWPNARFSKSNCICDSKEFQDAVNSQWKFPRYQSTSVIMLSRSTGIASLREGPPSIWKTHGISWNVFRKFNCVLFCGEVEEVVGAITSVVGGVAQVFHDLLLELQLLLVAEVEDGEETDRRMAEN